MPRIAIVELMDRGHVSLVEALVKILAVDAANAVDIHIRKGGFEQIRHLEHHSALRFCVMQDGETIAQRLGEIAARNYDELFITTLDKYIADFVRWDMPARTNLFIHNIDLWFYRSLPHVLGRFMRNLHTLGLNYNIKQNLLYPWFYGRMVSRIIRGNGFLIVLNEKLKHVLAQCISETNIKVLPFQVFDPALPARSERLPTGRIRICIPGEVSQLRRDYMALFDCFLQHGELTQAYALDLLGVLPDTEATEVLRSKITALRDTGMPVFTYGPKHIPMEQFDREALQADIIMGNMHVMLMGSAVYGKTKDTGAIYSMIKYAQPGLLPAHYDLIDALRSSVLVYKDYGDLAQILLQLSSNREQLNSLKEAAWANALHFTPEHIYRHFREQ